MASAEGGLVVAAKESWETSSDKRMGEIRSPKSEVRRKAEIRNPNAEALGSVPHQLAGVRDFRVLGRPQTGHSVS